MIVYAFMQAVGMVNDHLTCCFRHVPIRRMGEVVKAPPRHDAGEGLPRARSAGSTRPGAGPGPGRSAPAAVILDPAQGPQGAERFQEADAPSSARQLEFEIKARAVAWGVGFASVEEIAELNILHATGLAMCRAIEAMAVQPAFALVDGNYRFPLPCPVKTVVKGDGLSCSIAAASILAKVARDRLMAEMDGVYPGYGFASHKGYRAPIHAEALLSLGPSPIHRMAWAPVKLALAGRNPMLAGTSTPGSE